MERVKLGDVEFSVVTFENAIDSARVTSHQVESGQSVSDHVEQLPYIINIRGQMVGEKAFPNLQLLRKYQKAGQPLQYIGRNSDKNMIIVEMDKEHGLENRTGFQFDITLQQVRIAAAKTFELTIVEPKVATAVKPETSTGPTQATPYPSMLTTPPGAPILTNRLRLAVDTFGYKPPELPRTHGGKGGKF